MCQKLTDNACSWAILALHALLVRERLGHINVDYVKKLKHLDLIPSFSNTAFDKCEICVEAKHSRTPFNRQVHRASTLLELIHSDLGDFRNTMSRGGKRYYITFVDDFSRYTKVYLLSTKDEAEQKFMIYKAEVENQLDLKIKRVRSDRGGEYDGYPLKKYCEENGIIHEITAPFTPQQNGIAERKNRSLKDMMNAMLISSGMPTNMWGEAILSACFVPNRVPHKKLETTPYELWKGHKPNLNYLKVWGCLGKIGIPVCQRSKIGPKTIDGIFIGYASNSAAYRFILKDGSGFGSIKESRDVVFFENIFPMKTNPEPRLPLVSNNVDNASTSAVTNADAVTEPRRSKRARIAKDFGPDFETSLAEKEFLDEEDIRAYVLENDPRTYKEAMNSIDSTFWLEAINSEIDSIKGNNTWILTDLPRGCKPLSNKWVFKKKLNPDGSIDKYKARLVVCGNRQTKGQEAEWLRNLLADIPLWGRPAPSVSMHCDSQATIGVEGNQAYNGKRRHIRLRHAIAIWLCQFLAASLNPTLMPTVFIPDMSKLDLLNGKNYRICKLETAKDIWDALKIKYGTDDFGTKKYACNRWLNFRITDDKPVLDQVHEYETLCADIIAEGMKICETFQANCLLEKLPLSWQNYVHSMKHKQKDFTLLELVSHIKIEEQNRIQLRGKQVDHSSSNANLVETKNRNKGPRRNNNNNHNNKGPNQIHGVKKQTDFKPKRPFKGECFTCGETGHSAKFCPQGSQGKSKNKHQAHLTETDEVIAAVVSEVNRSDRGGEYDGYPLKKYCEENGIIHEITAPFTPQQNGIAERKNRSLKDMMNAMLISSGMPTNMWGEAILSACFVPNRVPHKKLETTPYELWKGHKPNLNYLKVWGCLGKIGIPVCQRSKIGPKTIDGIFIGYASNSAAYRFILKDGSGFGSIKESRDVVFFENIFPMKTNPEPRLPLVSNNVDNASTSAVTNADAVTEPRRSKRARIAKDFGPDFETSLAEKEFLDEEDIRAYVLENDPRTYKEAMNSIDSTFWLEAINSEIDSIKGNNTWILTDLPRGCKPLSNKWVFKKKLNPDGSIDKYKARLVVCGNRQTKGLDFFDTYSPVTKVATIRALIALASIHDLFVHQMDVKMTF
ncbi:uncharacterized protein LOC141617597 [Silene latifolia]|uniref:uncharacterized protein LOC141617597 n=1 Tax=Silene latifolia TaxID=37657 RepID=UPI003D76A626